MKIYAKQIDSVSLQAFINEAVSGSFFSGQLDEYIDANGYFGPNLVYASGGNQSIHGVKTFASSPVLPYSGGTGNAVSRKYVDDQDNATIVQFSGNYINNFLINTFSEQTIGGIKTFTGAVVVGEPILTTHAATKNYVDTISGAISSAGNSAVRVTGSPVLAIANFVGEGGTIVRVSGDFVLISGAGSSVSSSDHGDGINLSGRLMETGALLSAVSVTGSNILQTPNFVGIGGTQVIKSGNNVLISGAGNSYPQNNNDAINLSGDLTKTGGLLSAVKITGSNVLQNVNFVGGGGILVYQSGNFAIISGGAGAGTFVTNNIYNVTGTGIIYFTSTGNTVTNTINVTSGTIYFTGASSVSVTGSSVIAFPNFTGVGGTLIIQSGDYILVSGGASVGGGGSNVSVTGSSTIASPNFSGIAGARVYQSGNYVLISGSQSAAAPASSNASYDMSFFLDSVQIGDNLFETFVSNNYTVSGVAFGCRTTGSAPLNGGILTGKIYQVDFNNTEQTILNFTFNTGVKYAISGGLSVLVTGKNRVGLSITNTISSIQNFTVGVFGA